MARLLLLSDSHRATHYVLRAAELFCREGFDAVAHLGDVFSDARRFCEITGRMPWCVRGNCDAPVPGAPPRERVETLAGVRLLLTHGDRYGVKSALERLSYRAEEAECDVALFGHTHRGFAGYVGRTLLVNPGALTDGRYAVLTVTGARVVPHLERF